MGVFDENDNKDDGNNFGDGYGEVVMESNLIIARGKV